MDKLKKAGIQYIHSLYTYYPCKLIHEQKILGSKYIFKIERACLSADAMGYGKKWVIRQWKMNLLENY